MKIVLGAYAGIVGLIMLGLLALISVLVGVFAAGILAMFGLNIHWTIFAVLTFVYFVSSAFIVK